MTSITASTSQTTTYTVLQTMRKEAVLSSFTYKPSSSWRKFIRRSRNQRKFKKIVTVVAGENTTVGGLIVLDTSPTTEELLSSPLFQVAGMFAIDEPGWADKHDEYIAETYL